MDNLIFKLHMKHLKFKKQTTYNNDKTLTKF